MADRIPRRVRSNALGVLVLALGIGATSCGGSGNPLPAELSVIDVTFVFPNDAPLDPTLTVVPRNTWIRMVFTKPVNPATLSRQTIRVRGGATLGTEAQGTFRPDGSVVRFDPTVRADGGPNPLGFAALSNFRLEIPSFKESSAVVKSIDDDPVVLGSDIFFSTSAAFLHESVPPRVLGLRFLPERGPGGAVVSNSFLYVDFDEVMLFSSLRLARDTLEPGATFDVRYTNAPINVAAGVDGRVVAGRVELTSDARSIEFRPFFSFGAEPFEFEVSVTNGLTDLAGNALANPQVLGGLVCDGSGTTSGTVLTEDFFTQADRDASPTTVDWGVTEPGICAAPPISSRDVFILGSTFATGTAFSDRGTYVASFEPLIGETINQVIPNLQPSSALGRRIMYAFSDLRLGAAGTITALAWGPDSNATFVASYPKVIIRAGFKENDSSLNLSPSFETNSANLSSLYEGPYTVAQAANIGNTPGLPFFAHKPGYPSGNFGLCNNAPNWNQPLYDYTGFLPWPALHSTFDWDPGDINTQDVTLLLDFDVQEGTSYQTVRGLFQDAAPCSGILFGNPVRKLRSTFGAEVANPPSTPQIINPEPTVNDTQITLTLFRTLAQSLFYTPAGHPLASSGGTTFGTDSDYMPAFIPLSLMGASSLQVEYQAATALLPGSRSLIDTAQPFTPWTTDVNDCDTLPFIRWRVRFIGNVVNLDVGRIPSVQIPVRDASFVP